MFSGFADLFDDFHGWLAKAAEARVHGHLFAVDRVQFAGNETIFKGGLSDSAALRDYNPRSFLTNLVWNSRGEKQCFLFGPSDAQLITEFLGQDPILDCPKGAVICTQGAAADHYYIVLHGLVKLFPILASPALR